ncbi:secreted serine protease [Streptomyces lincolnensis]|uniref:Secreted serine protease n=1 Tax=Streptomyces lincolnensis TaxID=1915 RepID=A0A1B1MDC2_STRLN|nr:type VII secretion-associated serine protease mycosin [Streptomyces lincolnensis]ANS66620.1 secreted serine protease [Streptomyces lincolnensis]AXG55490.1 secreted serine protease [Streptomyces lincolnensis]QMV08007.1 type VII secretion-associated serine protease mycosin [Streptomyces lincolnensis]
MRTSSTRYRGRRAAAAAALGLLLVGAAGTPAQASTREKQWFLDAMKAEQMWQTSTGKGITVAVIDTGVDPSNPDLEGQILKGKDFATDQSGDEHTDYEGHGTGMAGLIAGTGAYDGGNGAFGLAPGSKILPVRLPKSGTAANEAEGNRIFNEALAPAIRYAADAGAKVINISQAASEGSPRVTEAVEYALDKGALLFAGVGNSGNKANEVMYPAATPGVVGVAAVGKNLRRTAESEYGPQVDMAAPGEDMVAACGSETGLCRTHGTSDATALASASAALIWSKHPTWTNNQVLRVMLNTIGAPTDGKKRNDAIGYGIVRPRIALQNPGDPGPANKYPLPDLAAAAATSPAPSTSAPDTGDASASDTAKAENSDDNSALWTVLGSVGAVVLVGALVTFVVVRRRSATSPQAAPAQQPPHPGGPYPHPAHPTQPPYPTPGSAQAPPTWHGGNSQPHPQQGPGPHQ